MASWQTEETEIAYATPFFKVHKDRVRNQLGKTIDYSYMEVRPVVAVIVLNADGKLLLQQTYRYPVRKLLWEIPSGYIDDGEEPLAAAKRELLEETGLASADWISLGLFHQMPGSVHSQYNFFLARNATPATDERDEEEDITNQTFFMLDEVKRMIREGDIQNAVVPVALGLLNAYEK